MEEQRATRSVDVLVAELARAQHGVVGRAQLLELGLTAKAVDSRLERGRLHPLHRGVYAVGHAVVGVDGQRLAAVLACGPNAVLSHRTAADAWGLLRTQARSIDITVTTTAGRRRPGITIHRSSLAQFETTTTPNGIATTTPARTLLDLAEVVPRRGVERAADQAEALRLFDLDDVERVLQAHAHRHGAARLRRLLAAYAIGERFTRSELEERFLALCERHGIPDPRVNARVAGLEVDFHWPGAHLVAELDGHTHHGTREAFERDRERDAHLLLHGIRTLRITRRRLIDEPEAIARLVLALSASR
jgi:very-short-patch-repair endonuclease